jgi:hypothetical protein
VVTLFIQVKTKFSKILIFLPLYFFLLLFFLRFSFFPSFLIIGSEDHVIEWMTAFAFATVAVIATRSVYLFKSNWLLVAAFSCVTLISIFIAGEEISWGQRLLGLESPEYFMVQNVQEETTLHNLESVQDLMGLGYLIVGIGGSVSFLIKKKIQNEYLRALLPNVSFFFYFLPLIVYGFIRAFVGPVQYKTWEESIELVIALGLLVHFYSVQRELRQLTSSKPKKAKA